MNKWIAMGLAVGGLVLVAFAVAWNAGNAIPEDHEMRFTVASQQGPAAVWAVVSDLEGQPAWRKDLEAVEQIEDIAGKPAWREDTTAGSSTTMVTAMWWRGAWSSWRSSWCALFLSLPFLCADGFAVVRWG